MYVCVCSVCVFSNTKEKDSMNFLFIENFILWKRGYEFETEQCGRIMWRGLEGGEGNDANYILISKNKKNIPF